MPAIWNNSGDSFSYKNLRNIHVPCATASVVHFVLTAHLLESYPPSLWKRWCKISWQSAIPTALVFPPVLRIQRFLIKLSVGNASFTPETQSVLFTTYAFRIRSGLQMTNFPSVIVKPWRSHKSTQGLMYTLMSRELNLTKRLHYPSFGANVFGPYVFSFSEPHPNVADAMASQVQTCNARENMCLHYQRSVTAFTLQKIERLLTSPPIHAPGKNTL